MYEILRMELALVAPSVLKATYTQNKGFVICFFRSHLGVIDKSISVFITF